MGAIQAFICYQALQTALGMDRLALTLGEQVT